MRRISSASIPVASTASSSVRGALSSPNRSSRYPYASRPCLAAPRTSASECPRARIRATIRAWASAAGVQCPSRSGTIPSATQRRRVAGETLSARATSVSESAIASLHEQVRLLPLEVLAVLRVDRLGDRDQVQGRLHVPAGLDPPPRDGHRDVLLA